MEGEIGVLPGLLRDAPTLVHEPDLEKDLFRVPKDPLEGKPPKAPKGPRATMPKDAPLGVIRLNKGRVFAPDGTPMPKGYIFDRLRQVDGLTVEEARLRKFPDKNGKPKRYSGDLAYDVATGWISVELPDAKAEPLSTALAYGTSGPLPDGRSMALPDGQSLALPDGQSGALPDDTSPVLPHGQSRLPLPIKSPYPPDHGGGRRLARWLRRRLRARPRRCQVALRGVGMPRRPSRQGKPDMGALGRQLNASAFMAMRDLPWGKYLNGEHREDVLKAHGNELSSLLRTVLRELKEGDSEWEQAVRSATPCRALLEFKRQGVWKVRVVVQGFHEDKVALDGPDYNYASDVVGLATVRAMMLGPRTEGDAIGQMDIATAFLQSDMFGKEEPPRYLRLKDPVTGTVRYFRQLGVVYGSASASKRWMETLHPYLVSIGFEQGRNEPCVFRHKQLGVTLASYVDDLLCKGPKAAVEAVFAKIASRFKCKEPAYLGQGSPLDHLGMYFAEDSQGTCLSMHNYIDAMVVRLGMEDDGCSKVRLPISQPIDDYEPLGPAEAKWFMSACGMIGWLSGTGRPDLRYAHSRISQHMAAPCKGALSAVKRAVKYCMNTRDWCLRQSKDQPAAWSHFSDSDHAGNAERQNYRRSQLGYVSMLGHAPIGWGSKASSVTFGPSQLDSADGSLPSGGKNSVTPVCHPKMLDLHPDVSSGAAEIYAASVALSEVLHLSYVCDEMGDPMSIPLVLQVDNAAAVAFAKGRVRRTKMKHIDVRQAWVMALRDSNVVQVEKVGTDDNLADLFTKILDYDRFAELRGRMMVNRRCDR